MPQHLPKTLAAWPDGELVTILNEELAAADPAWLAPERLLARGSHVVSRPRFIILGSQADDKRVTLHLGVFFQSVIAGCACADDPTPEDRIEEYGELRLTLDRHDAHAEIEPVDT